METQLVSQTNSGAPSLCVSNENGHCSDAVLTVKAKAGSVAAFGQLVERHEAKVLRVAESIAHSREDAEEITQTAFVRAFSHLPDFRGDARFSTWVMRIAINEGLMRLRQRRWNEVSIDSTNENEEGIVPRELHDSRPTPEERCSHEEIRSILAITIGQLPPRYRTVFQLRDVEGFSTKETARALDLSLTAVKSRLRRARIVLRGSLQKCRASLGAIHNQRSQGISGLAFTGRPRSLEPRQTVIPHGPDRELTVAEASARR